MGNEFKIRIREQLIEAAQDYFKLTSITIVVESDEFVHQKRYLLKFNKSNFLHLTGVYSSLSANEFFDKCFNGTVALEDFDSNEQKNKSTIKKKMKNLVNLSTSFNNEILVQEDFIKNRIVCKIATSDNERPIGFVDGNYCVWPNTLLDKNHLDNKKPIIKVVPLIK